MKIRIAYHTYQVIVGNIGTVYSGTDGRDAIRQYQDYVLQSKTGRGRAGQEPVTIFQDGEILLEYVGTLEQE